MLLFSFLSKTRCRPRQDFGSRSRSSHSNERERTRVRHLHLHIYQISRQKEVRGFHLYPFDSLYYRNLFIRIE